jgi:L-lactate dehydrogenase complex protein LldG
MSSARDRILSRIRQAQGRGGSGPSEAELDAVQGFIRGHSRGPLPPVEGDLVTRFRARAESLQSTTDEVATLSEAPGAIARYLQANSLALRGCVSPALAALPWQEAGLDLEARNARNEDMLGVTGVFAALAETGTLVLASGADTPGGVSLLPETHVAIVPVSRIVAYMEDAWDLTRGELGDLPRAISFVSGPSRTGDIEQQIVLGAHGPYRVHIVLIRR